MTQIGKSFVSFNQPKLNNSPGKQKTNSDKTMPQKIEIDSNKGTFTTQALGKEGGSSPKLNLLS